MPNKPPTFKLRPSAPRPPDDRPSAHKRGYDWTWRKIRLAVLASEPLCRPCAAEGLTVEAVHVDHDVPLEAGGTNDLSNLVPMCHSCHSRKTVLQDGGLGHSPKGRPGGRRDPTQPTPVPPSD